MDRKSQENLVKARRYFNVDLSKNVNDKYNVKRINSEIFERGKQDAYAGIIIPDDMKDNFSYMHGFEHGKRELKIREDMYKMGQEHFLNGRDLEDALENYKNNLFFVQGFEDARKLNNIRTTGRSGR